MNKPLRPCRHPGCRELVPSGYCPKHQPPRRSAVRKDSEAWHGLYRLDVWTKQLRPEHLAIEPFCRSCWLENHRRVPATEVDHITPHRGDMDLFLDPANLQSLCSRHHSQKTMQELKGL